MTKVYSFNDYDKYFSLKAGPGLWLVVFYLTHPYLLLFSAAGFGKGRSGGGGVGVEGFKNIIYPDNFVLMAAILATLPTLLFIYAWARRRPGAPEAVRKIWPRGAYLLGANAVLNILIVFMPLLTGSLHSIRSIHISSWGQVVLSILVIVYLGFSQRVKDMLADFPKEVESDNAGQKNARTP